ncbi:UNVERIFIED_CONTAM: hypothetical protein K2H54_019896 [Gekko kuhli]
MESARRSTDGRDHGAAKRAAADPIGELSGGATSKCAKTTIRASSEPASTVAAILEHNRHNKHIDGDSLQGPNPHIESPGATSLSGAEGIQHRQPHTDHGGVVPIGVVAEDLAGSDHCSKSCRLDTVLVSGKSGLMSGVSVLDQGPQAFGEDGATDDTVLNGDLLVRDDMFPGPVEALHQETEAASADRRSADAQRDISPGTSHVKVCNLEIERRQLEDMGYEKGVVDTPTATAF